MLESNIIVTHISIKPEAKELFVDWQSRLQNAIANFPGFLSLEILAPNEERSFWIIVQRFADSSSANDWKDSKLRKDLFQDLDFMQEIEERICNEEISKGATEVIITETHPDQRNFYGQWLARIHQAEAKIQGFRGMYVQSPVGEQGKYWVTFLQFDSTENLERWLASSERKEILKELDPLIKAFESHRVISPYAGWFGSIAKNEVPAVWKQTMLVLLVLFPIVMLELKFLNPRLQNLNLSLATFIGNAISVALISWPMLPMVIFFFTWWLRPQNTAKVNAMGVLILLVIYVFEILIFL